MLKYILVITLLLFVGLTFTSLEQKSSGPPGCFAGEPPNFTNCTTCHSGSAVNTGTATITLDLGTAQVGYYPDSIYNFTISVQQTGMEAAGFQFIALQDNDNSISPGTMILTEPQKMWLVTPSINHTQGCLPANRVWVEHKTAGIISDAAGLSQWSFQWRAPNANVGNISFYLAALQTNHDLEDTGDKTYTQKVTSPCLLSSTTPLKNLSSQVLVYPNPSNVELFVETPNQIEWEKIQLIDLNGRVVKDYPVEQFAFSGTELTLDVRTVPMGLYFLSLKSKGEQAIKKVMIL